MAGYVQVRRDAFARETLIRELEDARGQTCAWCGQARPRGSGKLFRYGVDPDSIGNRTSWDRELFCCIGCRDAYYS